MGFELLPLAGPGTRDAPMARGGCRWLSMVAGGRCGLPKALWNLLELLIATLQKLEMVAAAAWRASAFAGSTVCLHLTAAIITA